jgi:hypothetical protein
MFGGVIGDAEGGIENKCLRVEITYSGLMGEVVVGAGGIEAYLQLDIAVGQTPVKDLADVYAYLRHYSKIYAAHHPKHPSIMPIHDIPLSISKV